MSKCEEAERLALHEFPSAPDIEMLKAEEPMIQDPNLPTYSQAIFAEPTPIQPLITSPQEETSVSVIKVPPPNNHSLIAWLTCLFCCCPLGVVAVSKSNEVDFSNSIGDFETAKSASSDARKYAYYALFTGIAFNTFCVGMAIIGVFAFGILANDWY